jgi:hypothetical protein
MPKVSVQLDAAVHAAVRTRAFREGVSLNDLGRGWFEAYAGGELAAGEQGEAGSNPRLSVSPAASVTASGKRCVREARHHINHSGKPCPECGYPKET